MTPKKQLNSFHRIVAKILIDLAGGSLAPPKSQAPCWIPAPWRDQRRHLCPHRTWETARHTNRYTQKYLYSHFSERFHKGENCGSVSRLTEKMAFALRFKGWIRSEEWREVPVEGTAWLKASWSYHWKKANEATAEWVRSNLSFETWNRKRAL